MTKRLIRFAVYFAIFGWATMAFWVPWLAWRFGIFLGADPYVNIGPSGLQCIVVIIAIFSTAGQVLSGACWLFPKVITPWWMKHIQSKVTAAFIEDAVKDETPKPVDWR